MPSNKNNVCIDYKKQAELLCIAEARSTNGGMGTDDARINRNRPRPHLTFRLRYPSSVRRRVDPLGNPRQSELGAGHYCLIPATAVLTDSCAYEVYKKQRQDDHENEWSKKKQLSSTRTGNTIKNSEISRRGTNAHGGVSSPTAVTPAKNSEADGHPTPDCT